MKKRSFIHGIGIISLTVSLGAALVAGGCDPDGNGGGSGGSGASTSSSSSSGNGGAGGSVSTGGAGGAGGGIVLMPGECRTTADCDMDNAGICLSPDAAPLCGVCYMPQNPCIDDAACAAVDPTTICEPPPCGCTDAKECMPGCMSDANCPSFQHCSPGHRCLPDTCATDADCGPNIKCDTATQTCSRKTCASDAECEDICVNGACYDTAGHCMLPPP